MFEQRSNELELMDTGAFDAVLADQSFRFIEGVNRFFGGTQIVWRFVREQAHLHTAARPLRVLDVGAGSCDIAVAVCRRAAKAGVELDVVCVERDSYAVARARRHLDQHSDLPITVEQADIFEHRTSEPYDIALMSMVVHHLDEERIRELVKHLATLLRGKALINELGRCWANYLGGAVLCALQPSGVRHDALLSVRKGFLPGEITKLLESVPGVRTEAAWHWPFRVRAVLSFDGETAGT